MKKIAKKLTLGVALAVLVALGLSCAYHGGAIVPDADVTKAFAAMQMDPGMNYYYSGSDAVPNAIVGLKKQYVIKPELWKPVTDEKIFRDQVEEMDSMASRLGTRQYGFAIKDDQGRCIGVFYSILQGRTYVKIGPDNEVIVGQPELLLYEREERGHNHGPLY